VIIDLAGDSQSLIRSSLINAVFIKIGQLRTPAGLRLASLNPPRLSGRSCYLERHGRCPLLVLPRVDVARDIARADP
jgi:hypothetical protein